MITYGVLAFIFGLSVGINLRNIYSYFYKKIKGENNGQR